MGRSSRSGSHQREKEGRERKADRHHDDEERRRSSDKDDRHKSSKRRHRHIEVDGGDERKQSGNSRKHGRRDEDHRSPERKEKSSGRKPSRDDVDDGERRRSKHSSRKRSRDEDGNDAMVSRKSSSHKHRDRRHSSEDDDDNGNPRDRKLHRKQKKEVRQKGKSRGKGKTHHPSSSKREDDKDKTKQREHRKKHDTTSNKGNDKDNNNDNDNVSFNDLKRHSRRPQKALVSLGEPLGRAPSRLLDATTDYFTYHQQFWVWLYRAHVMAFNDLTSEQSHEAFAEFVEYYNTGRLEAAYYTGLPPDAIEECKTTQHKWSFQTSEVERRGLLQLQEGVRKLTEYSDPNDGNNLLTKKKEDENTSQQQQQQRRMVPPRGDTKEDEADDNLRSRQWTAEKRLAHRTANKRLHEHARTAEEEFSGGRADYGRERQLEKKRELATKIHGSARDRDEARMGGVEVSDRDLYGDDGRGESFQAALAREKKHKAQREEKKASRIQELQQKEQSKQEAMLQMLGLEHVQPGKKITIAPRNDAASGGTK